VSAYLYPLYVTVHLGVFLWCLNLIFSYRAPGAAIIALITGGLVYDNLIISLGTTIGIGPLLQNLSWPRFAMHALLTPFMIIAVTQIAVAGGVRWAASPVWRVVAWVLVGAMAVYGALEHLVGLQTFPACFDGIVRYTTNLAPSHFCFEEQVAVKGAGPPIPSIVGNIITLAVGIALLRSHRWPWLAAGALVMFAAAGVPIDTYGMAASNGGEAVLMLSFVATINRFARKRAGQLGNTVIA
jgi:hypothetical protein